MDPARFLFALQSRAERQNGAFFVEWFLHIGWMYAIIYIGKL